MRPLLCSEQWKVFFFCERLVCEIFWQKSFLGFFLFAGRGAVSRKSRNFDHECKYGKQNSISGPKFRDFWETGLRGQLQFLLQNLKNKFLKRRRFYSPVLNVKNQVDRLRKFKMIKLNRPDSNSFVFPAFSVTLKCTQKSSLSWQRTKCLQTGIRSPSWQLFFSRYRNFYTISLIFPLIIAVAYY